MQAIYSVDNTLDQEGWFSGNSAFFSGGMDFK
jgi:hypothetical protein